MSHARAGAARLRVLAGMAVGLGPGFVLPFAVALHFSPQASDTILIALSVSLLLVNVVVSASEASSISVLGAHAAASNPPHIRSLLRLSRRNALLCAPVIAVSAPLFFVAYASQTGNADDLLVSIGVLAVVPLLGAASAPLAAALIVEGNSPLAVASQGARSILALLGIVVVPEIGLIAVVALYAAGEAGRLLALILHRSLRRPRLDARSDIAPVEPRQMYWQYAASGATQLNATVDRLFLSGTAAGNVTAYELGEKIAYAVFQWVYSASILDLIAKWSRSYSRDGDGTLTALRSDLLRLIARTSILAATVGAAVAVSLATVDIPEEWRLGLLWSLISLVSMPFAAAISALMRLLVILGVSRAMFLGGLFGLGVNIIGNVAMFALLGPVGIVVSGVITRIATVGAMGIAVITALRRPR